MKDAKGGLTPNNKTFTSYEREEEIAAARHDNPFKARYQG